MYIAGACFCNGKYQRFSTVIFHFYINYEKKNLYIAWASFRDG